MEEISFKEVTAIVVYGSQTKELRKISSYQALINEIADSFDIKSTSFCVFYITDDNEEELINNNERYIDAINKSSLKILNFTLLTKACVENDEYSLEEDINFIAEGKSDDESDDKESIGEDKLEIKHLCLGETLNQTSFVNISQYKIHEIGESLLRDSTVKEDTIKSIHITNLNCKNITHNINLKNIKNEDQATIEEYTKNISDELQKQLSNFIPDLIKACESNLNEENLRRDLILYNDIIHHSTVCSECNNSPIIGILYKCVICK